MREFLDMCRDLGTVTVGLLVLFVVLGGWTFLAFFAGSQTCH